MTWQNTFSLALYYAGSLMVCASMTGGKTSFSSQKEALWEVRCATQHNIHFGIKKHSKWE